MAKNILNNLKYAEEHIKVDGDGNNTINRAVVQSLISRFCLFEGTWRKYHALPNATTSRGSLGRYSSSLSSDKVCSTHGKSPYRDNILKYL